MNIIVDPEMPLLEILQKISSKLGLNLPSKDFIFTVECPEFKNLKDEDFLKYHKINNDKILNINQKIKDLQNSEFFLIRKIHLDSLSNRKSDSSRRVDSHKRYYLTNSQQSFQKISTPNAHKGFNMDILGIEYKEFYAYSLGMNCDRKSIIIGIDTLFLYILNKEHNNGKYNMNLLKNLSYDLNALRLSHRSIIEIEKAIFDEKRMYLYFFNNSNKKERYDLEFINVEDTIAFYSKIQDIIHRNKNI